MRFPQTYYDMIYHYYRALRDNKELFRNVKVPHNKKGWSYDLFVARYPNAKLLLKQIELTQTWEFSEYQLSVAVRMFCYNKKLLLSMTAPAIV